MTKRRTYLQIALGLGLAAFIGCAGDHGFLAVTGEVDFDAQPLESGAVTFLPLEGGSVSSGANIQNGKFALPADRGLPAGQYEVRIVAYRPTGTTVPDSDRPGEMAELSRQIIPARYNSASELRIQVGPENANHFRFDLESKSNHAP